MSDARPLRLFVAAYPPAGVAEQLVAQLTSMNLRGMKPSLAAQVNLTLQFIGDTDHRQLEDVQESVQRSVSGLSPVVVTVHRLISLPERGLTRLVAAELEPHPTLLELHRRLAMRLAKNAKERSGDRFLPHMTLGRYSSGSGDRVEVPVAGLPPIDVAQVVLVRSALWPGGAEHRPLGTFPLV